MAETAREYLIHRFRGDAQSLRERAASLQRGTSIPGPDAATSARMADACEAVVQLLEGIGQHDEVHRELTALAALIPQLEAQAKASGQLPPVRAVYAGAATRIREVEAAEAKGRANADDSTSASHGDIDDGDLDDDDDEAGADDA